MTVAELPPRMVCPLRLPFESLRNVMDHCAQIPHQQLPERRYREYLRAGVMARRQLTKLFDKMTQAELATVRWDDIADDVADLSTLARNPE